MKLKYLCVIEIESNPRHYNNGIIDLQKSPLSLMFLTWDGRLLKKVAAVSRKVPDSLGIHNSGATEDLKVVCRHCISTKFKVFRTICIIQRFKVNLRTETLRLLPISTQTCYSNI